MSCRCRALKPCLSYLMTGIPYCKEVTITTRGRLLHGEEGAADGALGYSDSGKVNSQRVHAHTQTHTGSTRLCINVFSTLALCQVGFESQLCLWHCPSEEVKVRATCPEVSRDDLSPTPCGNESPRSQRIIHSSPTGFSSPGDQK